jgi:hypothetical protein
VTILRPDYRLEFHFRESLSIVTFHLGNCSMCHQAFMGVVLGMPFASRDLDTLALESGRPDRQA